MLADQAINYTYSLANTEVGKDGDYILELKV